MANLAVSICGLELKNPVMCASGTFGYGAEMERFFDPSILGALVGKSITLEPRAGNAAQRMAETPAGMLNTIGLQNPGIERYLTDLLPQIRSYAIPNIVSIAGTCTADYVTLAQRLTGVAGVEALELNLSCPNVEQGGLSFSASPALCQKLCAQVREATSLPLLAKLTPNVTDIAAVARAAEAGGADAIVAVNTVLGMAVDWARRRPLLPRVMGGLSGPAIKPIALRCVWQVARAVDIPVVGVGGIVSARDALEFMVAGASAVQVGTATYMDPFSIPRMIEDMTQMLENTGVECASEIVGSLKIE